MEEKELKEKLSTAKHFLFVTGAGLGVASGLKTFRGDGGYWKSLSFEQLASQSGFNVHPAITWEWYNERWKCYENAKPNTGHEALVTLENTPGLKVEIATQNVDGLHLRAGSNKVYELHGNLRFVKCNSCKYKSNLTAEFDLNLLDHACGGKLRPNVVWFGEDLPEVPFRLSTLAAMDADVIVVAGTSSQVYPAAGLIDKRKKDCLTIEINPESSLKHKVDYVFSEGTETGIPKLVEMIIEGKND